MSGMDEELESKEELRPGQEPSPEADPFSDHNLLAQIFINTSRTNDILMSLLRESNPEAARDVLTMHAQGHILYTSPAFSGVFVADEMNSDEQDEEDSKD